MTDVTSGVKIASKKKLEVGRQQLCTQTSPWVYSTKAKPWSR